MECARFIWANACTQTFVSRVEWLDRVGFLPLDTCNHYYTQFPILSLFLNFLNREV